jgi:hypothetical protein
MGFMPWPLYPKENAAIGDWVGPRAFWTFWSRKESLAPAWN